MCLAVDFVRHVPAMAICHTSRGSILKSVRRRQNHRQWLRLRRPLSIASTNEPDIYVKAGYASMYPDQKVIIRRKKTEI